MPHTSHPLHVEILENDNKLKGKAEICKTDNNSRTGLR